MQVIVTKEFEESRHVWLKSLTRSMDIAQAEKLLDSYDRLEGEEQTRLKGMFCDGETTECIIISTGVC